MRNRLIAKCWLAFLLVILVSCARSRVRPAPAVPKLTGREAECVSVQDDSSQPAALFDFSFDCSAKGHEGTEDALTDGDQAVPRILVDKKSHRRTFLVYVLREAKEWYFLEFYSLSGNAGLGDVKPLRKVDDNLSESQVAEHRVFEIDRKRFKRALKQGLEFKVWGQRGSIRFFIPAADFVLINRAADRWLARTRRLPK